MSDTQFLRDQAESLRSLLSAEAKAKAILQETAKKSPKNKKNKEKKP